MQITSALKPETACIAPSLLEMFHNIILIRKEEDLKPWTEIVSKGKKCVELKLL